MATEKTTDLGYLGLTGTASLAEELDSACSSTPKIGGFFGRAAAVPLERACA